MQIILLLIPAVLIILMLSALSYFVLLTVNNIISGYRGISVDKGSPEYKKRKRMLKIISIPLSILILIAIGLLR
jgi:hypothetical protein